jgi:hypothetical protein
MRFGKLEAKPLVHLFHSSEEDPRIQNTGKLKTETSPFVKQLQLRFDFQFNQHVGKKLNLGQSLNIA